MPNAPEDVTLPPETQTSCAVPVSSLQRLLKDKWADLHPNIQERFRRDPLPGANIVYAGSMEEIRCSKMGRLFAYLTRVIGNPLTPHEGKDVPMRVELIKVQGYAGVCWQRTYFYPRRKPYVVISVKRENELGQMMECVGGGFGMVLDVYPENGSLHFVSKRYFWQVLGKRVPLPHFLAPGKTHVIHDDLGGGAFRFTISMVHPQLGETFYQTGIFRRA